MQLRLVYIFHFLFFAFGIQGFCQQNILDSLNKLIRESKSDTEKCNLLVTLAETIYISNPDTVIPLSEQTIAIADKKIPTADKKERNSLLIAKASALNNIGMIKGMQGNHTEEINYINKSLKIQLQLNNTIGIAAAYNNLGYIYTDYGDFPRSLDYYHKAIPLQEKCGDKEGLANTFNNIGFIYLTEKESELALMYFNKSLIIRKEIEDIYGQAMCLNNIGNLYEKLGIPGCGNTEECLAKSKEKALEFYLKTYALQSQINDKQGMAYSLNNIAIQYKTIGYPIDGSTKYSITTGEDTAMAYFKKSIELQHEIANKKGLALVYNNLSALLLKKGNIKEAKKHATESLEIGEKIGIPEIITRAAGTLKEISMAENNYQEAYKYLSYEIKMRDSINNEDSRKITLRRNFQYEFDKKTAEERAKAKAEKEINELKLQKEKEAKNNLIIVVVVTSLLALILILFIITLVRSNKQRKEAYRILSEKNMEIQRQTVELVKLSKEITRYQSQMNPHFIFNALNSIQGLVINNEKEKSLNQLSSFAKLMRTTLNNSGKESISIKEEIDYLTKYINIEQERFNNRLNFILEIASETEEYEIPPMLIQPLIENSLKHASLHTLEIPKIILSIIITEEHLQVMVKDNGTGFNKNAKSIILESHALSIIKSRIELLYQSMHLTSPAQVLIIKSIPEIIEGTEITLLLPKILKF